MGFLVTELFSTREQLQNIATILSGYLKLPFSGESIPGAVVESVIAIVRNGDVLNTYDFVDVINKSDKLGWQVKSTKAATTVTWKRAKIADADRLITESRSGTEGTQALGDSILHLCNEHAKASMERYQLKEIGFARVVVHKGGAITYYEKLLCDQANPKIFDETQFEWRWSKQKNSQKKEQLSALHGIHRPSGTKWFAWHGLGENQLHFSGESSWWPTSAVNKIDFKFPSGRLTQEQFSKLLTTRNALPIMLASMGGTEFPSCPACCV
jgi:hypothetical protein